MEIDKIFNEGFLFHQTGEFSSAELYYEKALSLNPNHFDSLHLLGVLYLQNKKYNFGLDLINKAIDINPEYPEAYYNRGQAEFYLDLFQEAIFSYDLAIKLKPDYADAYNNRGFALRKINDVKGALKSHFKAIEINPNYAESLINLAEIYKELNELKSALFYYEKTIKIKPNDADIYLNRGNILRALRRYKDALESYDCAIAIKPNFAEAFSNRGNVLRDINLLDESIKNYKHAISIKNDLIEANINCAQTFQELNNLDESLYYFNKVLKINSQYDYFWGMLVNANQLICNWNEFYLLVNKILNKINNIDKICIPFHLLAVIDDLRLIKVSSEVFASNIYPRQSALNLSKNITYKSKIKVGYFSADFKEHAVAYLTAELFELHDKRNFEIIGFSFNNVPNDLMQSRLKKAFDQFHDVSEMSDLQVSELARDLDVDIAVDLGGYTKNSRTGIFAYKPAPIQLSYIGYLGTMGASYYDYLIADSTLIPKENQQYYTEKIVYLPSYQVNDRKRKISDKKFTKSELNIAEESFVFCCFNNNYKITPSTFDGWMRILKAVDKSVLFLYAENQWAQANLIKEAQIRGVNPDRLIFGQKISRAEYLARYRVADLFLDTLPYNAGTTASDALWAGLPVLTLMGESFAARMAASLLNAIEMPELITHTQEEYEAKAIELARNPALLGQIKQKLARNRLTTPLFDTPLFTRHIEAAYKEMYKRYHDDLPPDHIYLQELNSKLVNTIAKEPTTGHQTEVNLIKPFTGHRMPTVKIDNKEYDLETLSDECKSQLASVQFVDQELARLQAKAAALQTAKAAYLQALKNSLPVVGGSDTIKLS